STGWLMIRPCDSNCTATHSCGDGPATQAGDFRVERIRGIWVAKSLGVRARRHERDARAYVETGWVGRDARGYIDSSHDHCLTQSTTSHDVGAGVLARATRLCYSCPTLSESTNTAVTSALSERQ